MQLLVVTQTVDRKDGNLGFFHRWVEEFAKHYSRIVVVASSAGEYDLPKNVSVFSLGKERGIGRLGRYYRFWGLFSHHYARSDAVFFHMIPEFALAASPFLLTLRKPSALWYVHKSVTPMLKIAEWLVDYVFTASPLSFRLPSKKVIYTGHAIDTQIFQPTNAGRDMTALRLLTVGRISPVKDLETILRAGVILKNSWSRPWVLSVVGGPYLGRDQEYLAALKRMVEAGDLQARVIFHGARPFNEIPALYEDHDLFISMSTTGSIDKAVLEAMSAGLSVITANEAFRELLPQPYFLEKRSPEFLASRIKMLADENRPNTALRNAIIEGHGLNKTINHISKILIHGV